MISSVLVFPKKDGSQTTNFIGSDGKPWISFSGLPVLRSANCKLMPPGIVKLWGELNHSSQGFWFCSVTFTDSERRVTYSVHFKPQPYGTCYIHVHGVNVCIPMSRNMAIKKLLPFLGVRLKKVKGKDDYYFA